MPNELAYTTEEIVNFANSSISAIQRELVLQALKASTSEEFDEIGLTLSGEKAATGFVYRTGASSRSGGEFWQTVKREVYDYVCTNSQKYKKERADAGHQFSTSVMVVATALAAQFHVGVGVITGIVTVGLISVAKIGRNAWCTQHAPTTES